MAEQQLVEYIKKAKTAGQSDDQTRTLLSQNGWTDQEINEAFSAAGQLAKETVKPAEPIAHFRPVTANGDSFSRQEHQVSGRPSINTRQDFKTSSQKPQQAQSQANNNIPTEFKPRAEHKKLPRTSGLTIKILAVAVLLIIIGAGFYVVLLQGDLIQEAVDKTFSLFPSKPKADVSQDAESQNNENENKKITAPGGLFVLSTQEIAAVPEEYDYTRINLIVFNASGDKIVYCAPFKNNLSKVSCFLNDQKFLDNPYAFKPYWVGISPDDQRIVFLYYDSAKKQSFTFENGVESPRVNGAINHPKFSRNSLAIAYVVIGNDGKEYAVVNGKPFSPHDKILTAPVWSGDDRYVLYGAMDGEKILWVADEMNPQENTLPETQPSE